MVQRLALLLGSLAAAAVVVVALAASGLAQVADTPATPTPAAPAPVASSTDLGAHDAANAAPAATTQVDTVYIAPAATPKTVRIERTAATPSPDAAAGQPAVRSRDDHERDEHDDHDRDAGDHEEEWD